MWTSHIAEPPRRAVVRRHRRSATSLGSVANAETKTELERRPIAERSSLIDCVYRHAAGQNGWVGDQEFTGATQLVGARGAGSHDRTGLLMVDPGFSSWN